MAGIKKKQMLAAGVGLALAVTLLALRDRVPMRDAVNLWLYDRMAGAAYQFRKAPQAINEILLVLIDNDTLNKMPSRWPYPRSDFAKVIDNLKSAGARAVAFDFAFLGRTNPADDAALTGAIDKHGNVILACSVNERGALDFCSFPRAGLPKDVPFGIVTKIQDDDGVARDALTYLVSGSDPKKGFLSWEMQVLNIIEPISFESLSNGKESVAFKTVSGKIWDIPVIHVTKSFLINYRAHTTDFDRLSFYDVLEGKFDPAAVRGRIAMVGLASSLFGDIHNTPIGWLPGITVNANAFLTLYTRDFLNRLPPGIEMIAIIAGVLLAVYFGLAFGGWAARLMVAAEVVAFLFLSCILYINGYTWNYFDFPFIVMAAFFATRIFGGLTNR